MYENNKFNSKEADIRIRKTPHLRDILEYFEKNLKKGYKLDALKYCLLNQGYSKIEVNEAIKILEEKTKKEREIVKKEEEERIKKQVQEEVKQVTEEQKKGFFARLFGK